MPAKKKEGERLITVSFRAYKPNWQEFRKKAGKYTHAVLRRLIEEYNAEKR